jgi:hypothetical protein
MPGVHGKGEVREESGSFLKKRTKKLFSIEAWGNRRCQNSSAAGIPALECLRRWELRARSARGKFFGSFFQKRTFLPYA